MNCKITSSPQLSVAVTTGTAGIFSEHSITTLAGIPANTGTSVSCTLIVCVSEIKFPQSSSAVQVLIIVKSLGQVPGIVTSVGISITSSPQLSVAVTTGATGTFSEHSKSSISAGTPISVGASVSSMVIV